jgi:hypothetical protein
MSSEVPYWDLPLAEFLRSVQNDGDSALPWRERRCRVHFYTVGVECQVAVENVRVYGEASVLAGAEVEGDTEKSTENMLLWVGAPYVGSSGIVRGLHPEHSAHESSQFDSEFLAHILLSDLFEFACRSAFGARSMFFHLFPKSIQSTYPARGPGL